MELNSGARGTERPGTTLAARPFAVPAFVRRNNRHVAHRSKHQKSKQTSN
jgi:hypothetical protein